MLKTCRSKFGAGGDLNRHSILVLDVMLGMVGSNSMWVDIRGGVHRGVSLCIDDVLIDQRVPCGWFFP